MSTKTKTAENKHEPIEETVVSDESKPLGLFVYPETIAVNEAIKRSADATHKDTIEEERKARYLPKAIDIVTGGLPSENEIATRNSERAWKRKERIETLSSHISSAAIGPMSGRPIEVILLEGENPDAVEVRLAPYEEMDPVVAAELGQLVKWTNEDQGSKYK